MNNLEQRTRPSPLTAWFASALLTKFLLGAVLVALAILRGGYPAWRQFSGGVWLMTLAMVQTARSVVASRPAWWKYALLTGVPFLPAWTVSAVVQTGRALM